MQAEDPKLPGEKRPTRFVPKPSARVQDRTQAGERSASAAFTHGLRSESTELSAIGCIFWLAASQALVKNSTPFCKKSEACAALLSTAGSGVGQEADRKKHAQDVLGSTGNVYHVELQPQGNSCTCRLT